MSDLHPLREAIAEVICRSDEESYPGNSGPLSWAEIQATDPESTAGYWANADAVLALLDQLRELGRLRDG